MIQLTESLIAVEVPNDATGILLIHGNTRLAYFHPNYVRIDLSCKAECLIGVTPLSEEQWKEVVENKPFDTVSDIGFMEVVIYKDYQYDCFDLSTATESGLSLLESKSLDINKKYVIIKIEK